MFFKKKTLLYIIPAQWVWKDKGYTDDLYYYLYEDKRGKRCYEVKGTGWVGIKYSKKHPIFLKVVYPWLKGKTSYDISSYSLKETSEKQVVVPKYNETWVDQLYNRYCEVRGRKLRELSHEEYEKLLIT